MRPAKLVQCIECGGNEYFIWASFFFFTCMFLPSSSLAFCPSLLMVHIKPSEEPRSLNSSNGRLPRFQHWSLIAVLNQIHWEDETPFSSGRAYLALIGIQILPLPQVECWQQFFIEFINNDQILQFFFLLATLKLPYNKLHSNINSCTQKKLMADFIELQILIPTQGQ